MTRVKERVFNQKPINELRRPKIEIRIYRYFKRLKGVARGYMDEMLDKYPNIEENQIRKLLVFRYGNELTEINYLVDAKKKVYERIVDAVAGQIPEYKTAFFLEYSQELKLELDKLWVRQQAIQKLISALEKPAKN